MADTPVRLDSGELGCPRCNTVLEIGKSPFNIHEEYVGHFESLLCSICNYHLFTATGYDNAIKKASTFGLVGQEETKEEIEVDNLVENLFTLYVSLNSVPSSYDKLRIDGYDNDSMSRYNLTNIVLPPIQRIISKSKTRSSNF